MNKKIRGITVQIGGDTSGLTKALAKVDSALNSTRSELKEVEKGLKFDPGNTKLAAQQQELLAQAIKQTSEKLRTLEENQDKVEKAFRANGAWEAQYAPIKARIEETSEALKKLRKSEEDFKKKHEIGEISDKEYEDFVKALEDAEKASKNARKEKEELDKKFTDGHINGEQYREYEREVEKTRKQLTDLEQQLDGVGKAAEDSTDGLKEAEKATKDTGDAAKDASKEVGEFKDELKSDIKDAAKVVAALSAAILAVGKASVDAGMEFDSSMQKVVATLGYSKEELADTGSEASRVFTALRDYAQQMGASTAFSASESADALNYMAMAGWNDEQMLDGLSGVLDLAAASGADLATTSDIVTDALTAMGYGAEEAGHLADVMAAASSNANTNVEMMGETFKYAAPVAGALGFSMEDVATAIGLMANSGIKASQAGTALRGWLSKLAAPTKESGAAMNELGISLTDSEGNMRSLREVMNDTRTAFADLTEAQQAQYAKMLAGQQGMSGLLAIVNAAPADFDKLTKAIDNSTGAAEKMAETNIDSLSGDITIMKSAIEGAEIAISDKLTPSLRKYTQIGTKTVTAMTDAFGKGGLEGAVDAAHQTLRKEMGDDAETIFKAEAAVKALTAAFIAYKGAMILTKGIAALEKVNALMAEGKTLAEAMGAVNLANPWVLALAAVTAVSFAIKSAVDNMDVIGDVYADFTQEQQEVMDNVTKTAQALTDSRKEYEENTAAIEANERQIGTLVDRLYALDSVQDKDAAQKAEMSAIVDELNGSVNGLNLKYDEQTGKLNKTRDAVDELVDSYFEEAKAEAYKNRLVKLIEEQAEAEEAHEKAVEAVEKAKGKRASAQNRLNSLTAAYIRIMNEAHKLEEIQNRAPTSWTKEKEAEYNALIDKANELNTSIQGLQAEVDNLDLGMGDLIASQSSSYTALNDVTGSIENIREKMGEAGVSVPEDSEAIATGISGISAAMDTAAAKADSTHSALTEAFYISEDLEPALDEVYELVDAYNNELESRKGALQSWFEGSVTVKDEDLSMNSMWAALNETTAKLDDWQAKIDKLTEEGVNDKYIQHLKDAGPESLNEINQLFTVPEDTRKQYADQWGDGYARAADVAEHQMEAAKTETNKKIGEIIGTIKENSPQMADTFNQLGIDGIDGYIAAFSDPTKLQELKDAVKAMVETAMAEVEAAQDSNSPAKEFESRGEDGGDGYRLGFENKETEVQKAAREMAENAIKAVESVKFSSNHAKSFAEELRDRSASLSAVRSSAIAPRDTTPNFTVKTEAPVIKMPETVVVQSYLDGHLMAENQAPYIDSINADRVSSERRGHAT